MLEQHVEEETTPHAGADGVVDLAPGVGLPERANFSRSASSGGSSRYRFLRSSPASAMTRSTTESRSTSPSPTAWRSTARSVSAWERDCTNPARCAASCTESVKTSAFFSAASSPAVPNRLDRDTDSSVAMAEPRNRMPSFCPHDGQSSSFEGFAPPSSIGCARTGRAPSSASSPSGGVVTRRRCPTRNHHRPSIFSPPSARSPSAVRGQAHGTGRRRAGAARGCRCPACPGPCPSARGRRPSRSGRSAWSTRPGTHATRRRTRRRRLLARRRPASASGTGDARRGAVEAGELARPQVHVDRQRTAAGHLAQVRERGEHGGEHLLGTGQAGRVPTDGGNTSPTSSARSVACSASLTRPRSPEETSGCALARARRSSSESRDRSGRGGVLPSG